MTKSKGKFIIIMVVVLLLCAINTLLMIEASSDTYGEESTERFFVGANPVPTANMNYFVSQNINSTNTLPSMTVLTHDIGGSAANWSNSSDSFFEGTFAYHKESIIEQLLMKAGDNALVLYAKVDSKNEDGTYNFYLRNIRNEYQDGEEIKTRYETNCASQDDLNIEQLTSEQNKHLIVVFEGRQGDYKDNEDITRYYNMQSNEDAYNELEFVVNRILYDMIDSCGVENPRTNLIGHGRGGLLNVMYATKYPKAVDSIFNLGTPYSGTKSEVLIKMLSDINAEKFSNLYYSLGYQDIRNEALYNEYKNEWNQMLINESNNIKAHTIASAMNSSFINGMLDEIIAIVNMFEEQLHQSISLASLIGNIQGVKGEENLGSRFFELTQSYNEYLNPVLLLGATLMNNKVPYLRDLNEDFLRKGSEIPEDENNEAVLARAILEEGKKYYNIFDVKNVYRENFYLSGGIQNHINNLGSDIINAINGSISISNIVINLKNQGIYGERVELMYYLLADMKSEYEDYLIGSSTEPFEYQKETNDAEEIAMLEYLSDIDPYYLFGMRKNNEENESPICLIDNISRNENISINLKDFFGVLDVNFDIEKATKISDFIYILYKETGDEINIKELLSGMEKDYREYIKTNNTDTYQYQKTNANEKETGILSFLNNIDPYYLFGIKRENGIIIENYNYIRSLENFAKLGNGSISLEDILAKCNSKENDFFEALTIAKDLLNAISKGLSFDNGAARLRLVLTAADKIQNGFILAPLITLAISNPAIDIYKYLFLDDEDSLINLLNDVYFRSATDFKGKWYDVFLNDELVFLNDFHVDYNSQKAEGYFSFTVKSILYKNYSSSSNVADIRFPFAVPHNTITRDDDAIGYILSKIILGNSVYSEFAAKKYMDDIEVYQYNVLNAENIPSEIIIQSTLPGREGSVVKIGAGFFESLPQQIKKVQIPSTVQEINRSTLLYCKGIEIEISSENQYYYSETIVDPNDSNKDMYSCIYSKDKTRLIKYIPIKSSSYTYTLNPNVEIIEYAAFKDANELTEVIIPTVNAVKRIGPNAFENCEKLSQFNFQLLDKLENIGSRAFIECLLLSNGNLSSLTSLTEIGFEAFFSSGLTSFSLPANLISLGRGTLAHCESLASIVVAQDNPKYKSQDNVLFNLEGTELIAYPAGNTSTGYEIPDTINSISDFAFMGASNLATISFPESLNKIGYGAFAYCGSILSIVFPKEIKEIEDFAFYKCNSLQSVLFTNLNCPDIGYNNFLIETDDGLQIAASFKIYVPYASRNHYKNTAYEYRNKMISKNTTITYSYNDTTVEKNANYYSILNNASIEPDPTREHYHFRGWCDTPNTDYDPDNIIGKIYYRNIFWDKFQDTTLYALWEPKSYPISYDLGNLVESQGFNCPVYRYDEILTYEPKVEGYKFTGWYKDAILSSELGKNDNGYYIISATEFVDIFNTEYEYIRLYPKFEGETYQISLQGYETPFIVNYGNKLSFLASLSPQLTNPGHKLIGWSYDNETYTSEHTWFCAKNATLAPVWKANTIILKIEGYATLFQVSYGLSMPELSFSPPSSTRPGYKFVGYGINGGYIYYNSELTGIRQCDFTSYNVTLYAQWAPESYLINLYKSDDNTASEVVSVLYNSHLPYSSYMNIHEKPERLGYDFLGYYDSDDICYYNHNMQSQRVWQKPNGGDLYARWKVSVNKIILYTPFKSIIPFSLSEDIQEFELIEPMRDGYTFKGWYPSSQGSYVGEPNESLRIYDIIIQANTFPDDISVFSHWTLDTYTIYDDSDSTMLYQINGDDDIYHKLLIEIESEDIPIQDGKFFTGWGTENKHYIKRVLNYNPNKYDYNLGDLVYYGGILYRFKAGTHLNQVSYPYVGSIYWQKISDYIIKSYREGDLVYYENKLYQCINKYNYNKNPLNNEYWIELSGELAYWAYSYDYQGDLTFSAKWEDQFYALAFYDDNDQLIGYYDESLDQSKIKPYSLEDVSFYSYGRELNLNHIKLGPDANNEIFRYYDYSNILNEQSVYGHLFYYVFDYDNNIDFEESTFIDFTKLIYCRGVEIIRIKLVWRPVDYIVSMQFNYACEDNFDINVVFGETYVSLQEPILSDKYYAYTFMGWYDNDSFTGEPYTNTTLVEKNKPHTLYAKLEMLISVNDKRSQDEEENENNIHQITVVDNLYLPNLEVPVRHGYNIEGYYLSEDYHPDTKCYDYDITNNIMQSSRIWKAIDIIVNNYTLYAKWDLIPYNIDYDTDEGTIDDDDYNISFNVESSFSLPTAISKQGYIFKHWINKETAEIIYSVDNHVGDIELKAIYEGKKINITLKHFNGQENIVEITIGKNYSLSVPSRELYTFSGWYLGSEKLTYHNGNSRMPWNKTIYALEGNNAVLETEWSYKYYPVSLDYDGGSGFVDFYSLTPFGQFQFKIDYEALYKDGYSFDGIYYDDQKIYDSNYDRCTTNVSQSMIINDSYIPLKVKWQMTSYSINYLDRDKSILSTKQVNIATDFSNYNMLSPSQQDVLSGYYLFECWHLKDGSVVSEIDFAFVKDNSSDKILNLYSKWTRVIDNDTYTNPISDEKTIIHLRKGIKIVLNESAKYLELIGEQGKRYEGFKIEVKGNLRTINIKLTNVDVRGYDNNSVIDAGKNDLILDCYNNNKIIGGTNYNSLYGYETIIARNIKISGTGNLEIKGGDAFSGGMNSGRDPLSGGHGILCKSIDISINNLSIIGGNGSIGANGYRLFTNHQPFASHADYGYAGSKGSDGASGNNGSKGGHGGIALICSNSMIVKSTATVTLKGGDGGKGGDGQRGQSGQQGQQGGYGKVYPLYYAQQGGKGGKAGDGGDGGDGGFAGLGILIRQSDTWHSDPELLKVTYGISIANGNVGVGGDEGQVGGRGAGGLGGETVWGNNADSGLLGDPGSPGQPGEQQEANLHVVAAFISAMQAIINMIN